jgi:hypothetical protein
MPVPTSVNDLSTTAASNSPAGTESPVDGDNYIRALSSFVAQQRDQLNGTTPTTAFTITTLTFTTANGTTLNLSGNAAITGTLGVTGPTTLTDLTTTGNTVLGNASTDTLNVGNGDIIKNSSGQTGIGTTPSAKFHVNSGASDEVARFQATTSPLLTMHAGATYRAYLNADSSALVLMNRVNAPMNLGTNDTAKLQIGAAGTIDMLSGSGSLRVNGHITRFESLTVAVPTSAGVGSLTTIAHGGTRVPDQFSVRLRCVITEHGYAVGAEVDLVSIGGSVTYSCSADATNIYFRMPAATGGVPQVFVASGGNSQPAVTAANWRLAVRAIWL